MLDRHKILLERARVLTVRGDYGAAKYYVVFTSFSATNIKPDVDARRKAQELEILIEACIDEEFRVIADERGLTVTEANRHLLIADHSTSRLRYLEILQRRQPELYQMLNDMALS